MAENKPKYIEGIGWRRELVPSMLRRRQGHDYQGRGIYMITIATEGRRPLLGTLCYEPGKPETAHIEPTPLGKEVAQCWLQIRDHYPDVYLPAFQLMPDHIHGLVFMTKEQEAHLGTMINGFKIGSNKAYRRLAVPQKAAIAVPYSEPVPYSEAVPRNSQQKHPSHGLLWEIGYQDSPLTTKAQLEHMFRYIEDNPRRLAVKREHPDLFRIVRNMTINGMNFAAIGNRWLLDRPTRLQVRCHRSSAPENQQLIASQKAYFLEQARKGGVLVSPCISAGEKEVARAALDAKLPLVVLLENGFPPFYKPPKQYFEACSEGLLLMLAPWPYHTEQRVITREQCNELNEMARALSTEPWTLEQEQKLGDKGL